MFQFRDNYDLSDLPIDDKNKAISYSSKIMRKNLELFDELIL